MATAEQHDVVIRWQQQGQAAVQAEANKIKSSFGGIGASLKQSLSGAASQIKSSLSSVAASAKQTGAIMSAAVTGPILLMAKNSIDAASDLNESMSAVKTVFGDSADEVLNFSRNAASSLGQSQNAALSAASALGALFQSIGLTNSQMADFTMNLETASADLGSFFNADPSEVLSALKSGLVGEAEPLRRFGILLNEAAIEAEGVKMGLIAAGDEMTDQQKVMARYSLIMSQIGVAQGDFARTSDGLANSQRILSAEIQDLSADIGGLLLPYAKDLTVVLKNAVAWVKNLSPEMKDLGVKIGLVAAAAGPVLLVLGQIATVVGALASGPLLLAAGAAVALYKAFESNFLGIRDTVTKVIDRVGEYVGRVVEFFQHAKDRGLGPFALAFRTMIVTIGEQLGADNPIVEFLQGIYRNGKKLADWWATDGSTTLQTISGFLSKGDFGDASIFVGHLAEDLKGGWDKTIGPWIDGLANFGQTVASKLIEGVRATDWAVVGDEFGAQLRASLAGLDQFSDWVFGAITGQGGAPSPGLGGGSLGGDLASQLGAWVRDQVAQVNWSDVQALLNAGMAGPNLITDFVQWTQDQGIDLHNQISTWLLSELGLTNWDTATTELTTKGGELFAGLQHGMQDTWNNQIAPWLQGLSNDIQGLFNDAPNWIASSGADVISGFLNGMQSFWNNSLSPWLHGVLDGLPGLLADAGTWLVQAGTDLIDGLRHGAQDLWNNTVGPWFSNLGKTISDALPKPEDLLTYLSDQGAALMQGLSDGFFGAFDTFKTDFSQAWNDFLDTLNPLPNAEPATPPPVRHGAGGGSRGTEDPALARAYGGLGDGWAWVGEKGRELVKLARGSLVIPHGASETRARAMAYGGVAGDWGAWLQAQDRDTRKSIRNLRSLPSWGADYRNSIMSMGLPKLLGEEREVDRFGRQRPDKFAAGRVRTEDRSRVPRSYYDQVSPQYAEQHGLKPGQQIVVHGNVTIHPPNADVAGEISRQFQTRNR